jgi:hypothetical protein
MKYGLVLSLLIAMPCMGQTKATGDAKTAGPCSPAVTGSNNKFQITCKIDEKQGQKMLDILNKILSNQLDPNAVMKKIDEMEASVKELHEQQEFSGLLSPADDPTPDNACRNIRKSADAMLILLGNSASLNPWFPHSVITAKGEDILTLNKKDNEIAVSVKIFGRDGRIVAEIRDNEFSINPNNYFRKERPDKSTLIVYDQEDRKVLDVRFLNPSTVRFLGVLNYPRSMGPLVISQTEGFFANEVCMAYNAVDFNIK